MKLHEVTDGLKGLGGEYSARTASYPRMTTWAVDYKYWSKGEKSRLYLELVADGKRYPIGYLNMDNFNFVYSPAPSHPREPMLAAKRGVENILKGGKS